MFLKFFVFLWLLGRSVSQSPCDDGWKYYEGYGLCYKAEIVPAGNFTTRIDHCRSLGGYLASLHNMFDNYFIRTVNETLSEYSLEFGLFYSDEVGFYNDDGSAVDYFNWEPDQDPPKGLLASSIEKDYTWYYDKQSLIWGGAAVCSKAAKFTETTPYEPLMECELGWTYWQHTEKCYKIDIIPLGQFNTRITHCREMNATLGSIHSALENYFIRNMNASLAEYSIEFGLFYEDSRGWFNDDGSPADYFNWDDYEDPPEGLLASELGTFDYTWSHTPQWYIWGGSVLCQKNAQPIR